jgi:CubicO group peptidase (beta-lactamase class C family)
MPLPFMTTRSARRARCCAAGACLAAGAALLPAPARADSFERIAAWIRAELETDATPSLAIAVARDGRLLWAEGFGFADKERRIAATPDTRYSLASISKPITATGLMMLAERGLVDLDRPINAYLDDARLSVHVGSPDAVTVRRVAMHMAGLPIHHHFFATGQKSPPPMDETIRRYGHVVAAPGERFQYSNLGYGVLGHLIARLAGRSYAEFMRDGIFLPLGMRRSSIGLFGHDPDDYAVRYARDGSRLPYYAVDHDGGSAVFSSARDLARFGLLHVGSRVAGAVAESRSTAGAASDAAGNGSLLSPAGIRDMQRPRAQRESGAYGIGWQITDSRYGRIVSHGGGMPGVTTSLTLVPSARLVIVVLANASSPLPALVTERVLAELAPRFAGPATVRTPARDAAPRSRRKPGRHFVGGWSGAVQGDGRAIPFHVRLDASGDVFARVDNGRDMPVALVSFQREDVRGLLRNVRLPTEDAGSTDVLHFILTRRGDALTGSVTAVASSERAPGFALSHWVELRRDPDPPRRRD